MTTKNEFFERNGYLHLSKLVRNPEDLFCPFPTDGNGKRLSGMRKHTRTGGIIEQEESQVLGSLSRYNEPTYRELHYQLVPVLQMALGVDILPTYYFDRFYSVGQELTRHVDRPSCEISVTLQVSTNRDQPWPIWFKRPDGSEVSVSMNNGDAVIYKGMDIEHWREPLKSRHGRRGRLWNKIKNIEDDTYHHQIFLHYVNGQGEYVQYANDAVQ